MILFTTPFVLYAAVVWLLGACDPNPSTIEETHS